MEIERNITLINKYGLHARASTRLAQVAKSFASEVKLARVDDSEYVDGKSILGLLTLGAENGQQLILRVRGDDAAEAISAIMDLVENKFDEE